MFDLISSDICLVSFMLKYIKIVFSFYFFFLKLIFWFIIPVIHPLRYFIVVNYTIAFVIKPLLIIYQNKPLTSPLQGAMDKDKEKDKDKIKEIDDFIEFRKSELDNYSDDIKTKLKRYKVTEPVCFIGNGIPPTYYDLVEILVNVIKDLEWQKDLINRFGKLKFELSLIDFYLTVKANSEYRNYKGEHDFKRHYTNWLTLKQNNYK